MTLGRRASKFSPFSRRCNTSLKGPLPSDSAFTSLFFELLKLRTSVEAIKLVEESDHDIPKELRAQAGALRQLWERLCTEGGVEKEERLPAGEIMTSGHLRFWVARQWHEPLVCEHSPARVTSTDWRFPLRRRSNGHFMASLKVKDKEYYLCDYQRSSKQKAIQWTGYDDKKNHITIEHNLWAPKKDLTPNTLHSSLNDGRIVRFPGKQQVVIKEYHHIILEDTRKIEYTFVDIRYSTRFHEDLRARKQKACVDVVTISSTEGPEANLEKLYLWRDVQRSDVQFHTLSYFSSKAEHREVEFPILWFRALLKREGSRTLILTFLSSSNRELRRSSTSSVSDTFGDMYVPKEEKQTLMQYQYLKIEFESVAECETFQADFEAIHYEDTLVHLLHCLPVPTSASMRRERTEVPHSHTSSNSTNTNATGHSSDRLTRGPSSNSSIDWWPPDWFPLTTQSPTSPSLPKPEPDGDPWAFV
ncbi:hypothetical protein P154DRAFT_519400 [Amniculicola lignicola CBS 123094]|uniref:Uncharacterized protein n=1 Tax=Amniculicola lignicola CBS 123094 TaxID=1392246 RepID=A0A6A5WUB5_9PLEO|nr:hypothetical protein P154DRAFT_519400 [Amniculicola lignicola CBS 123094]